MAMMGAFTQVRVRSLAFYHCDPNINGCMYWDHSIRAWNQCKGVIQVFNLNWLDNHPVNL
jgi:hypothetical protein